MKTIASSGIAVSVLVALASASAREQDAKPAYEKQDRFHD
jgi:hypothetical protein